MGKHIVQQFMAESLRSFGRNQMQFSFMSVNAEIIPLCDGVFAVCVSNIGSICNIHENNGKPVAILC